MCSCYQLVIVSTWLSFTFLMPNHNSVWFLFSGSDSIIHVHVQYLVMTAGKKFKNCNLRISSRFEQFLAIVYK